MNLNLWQLIETPTHIAGNILDLLLTNNNCYPELICELYTSFELNLRSFYDRIRHSLHFTHFI